MYLTKASGTSILNLCPKSDIEYTKIEEEYEMSRVYNFSAGPAVLPEEVLQEAADEMLDYRGTGMSVMEMSHRSKMFQDIIDEAEADLRDLMNIPSSRKLKLT